LLAEEPAGSHHRRTLDWSPLQPLSGVALVPERGFFVFQLNAKRK
jgi:hypothetical protein